MRRLRENEKTWLSRFWEERWGADFVFVHGKRFTPEIVDGITLYEGDTVAGLVTYFICSHDCEIISLDSLAEGRGVGSALLAGVAQTARKSGCRRLMLVTTNDNLRGLKFYQKRGFRLCALRPGVVDESRKMKPAIPLTGEDGIPIHDEIEMEFDLRETLDGEKAVNFE